MKAVVFEGPKKVSVQDRPIPECEFSSASFPFLTFHTATTHKLQMGFI